MKWNVQAFHCVQSCRESLGNFRSVPLSISRRFRTIEMREDEELPANRARNKERAKGREKKDPESTRETRGGEWEKVNVIAVIFGRWLLPGLSLLPSSWSQPPCPPLPPSSSDKHSPLFLFTVLFVRSLSHFLTCVSRFASPSVHFFFPLTLSAGTVFPPREFQVFCDNSQLDIRRSICRVQRSCYNDRLKYRTVRCKCNGVFESRDRRICYGIIYDVYYCYLSFRTLTVRDQRYDKKWNRFDKNFSRCSSRDVHHVTIARKLPSSVIPTVVSCVFLGNRGSLWSRHGIVALWQNKRYQSSSITDRRISRRKLPRSKIIFLFFFLLFLRYVNSFPIVSKTVSR